MKKRIIAYRTKIDEILKSNDEIDWEKIMDEHLVQIGFYQHERLVHLLVTLAFALMEIATICTLIATGYQYLVLLAALLLILLIPYVFHYYTLENEVQKMYVQYDEIRVRIFG